MAYPPAIDTAHFIDTIKESELGKPHEARVARTSGELSTKHLNTLVAPSHGVVFVRLEVGAAKSNSYGGSEEKTDGSDTFHYAPGVETAKIKYKIVDPHGVIESATIEIFRRWDKEPLYSRELTEEERKDGDHDQDFKLYADDDDTKDKNFPDHVLTVEHSPYKIRVFTRSKWRSTAAVAWTFVHVVADSITLDFGDKETIPELAGTEFDGSNHKLLEELKTHFPAEADTLKVPISSNLFKTNGDEMYNNKAFDLYKKQWGDGPSIPIYATIKVKKADDTAVEDGKALGRVRLLWDYIQPAKDHSGLHAQAQAFVSDAYNYSVAAGKPVGSNCHADRGGLRDKDPTKHPVFPKQSGYEPADDLTADTFPFKVEGADKRKWSALSQPWTTGKLKSKSGVLFRPSRMAGDLYQLRCHLAWEKNDKHKLVLDVDSDGFQDSDIKATVGKFHIWKRHLIAKYTKKKAFANSVSVAGVQGYYAKGNIEMKQGYAAITTSMAAGPYNTAITDQFDTMSTWAETALDTSVNQYNNGNHCVTFRSYNNFKSELKSTLGLSNDEFDDYLTSGGGVNINTAAKYEEYCDTWGMKALEATCDAELQAEIAAGQTLGVTIYHFENVHNIGGGGGLNGYAADLAHGSRQRAGFITCATAGSYSGNSNSLEQTTSHEIGHHLFMPHAPDGVGADAGPAPTMHDKDDHNCTMSYNFSAERKWCGYCLLRLSGWNKNKLKNDSTKNHK